jgi:hypothetical protein
LATDLPASGKIESVSGLVGKLAGLVAALGEVAVADLCGVKVRMLRLALAGDNRFGPKPLGTIARNIPRLRDDVLQYLVEQWADSPDEEATVRPAA